MNKAISKALLVLAVLTYMSAVAIVALAYSSLSAPKTGERSELEPASFGFVEMQEGIITLYLEENFSVPSTISVTIDQSKTYQFMASNREFIIPLDLDSFEDSFIELNITVDDLLSIPKTDWFMVYQPWNEIGKFVGVGTTAES